MNDHSPWAGSSWLRAWVIPPSPPTKLPVFGLPDRKAGNAESVTFRSGFLRRCLFFFLKDKQVDFSLPGARLSTQQLRLRSGVLWEGIAISTARGAGALMEDGEGLWLWAQRKSTSAMIHQGSFPLGPHQSLPRSARVDSWRAHQKQNHFKGRK